MDKKCICCNKIFSKRNNEWIIYWNNRKYCSKHCANSTNSSRQCSKEKKEKIRQSLLGHRLSDATKDKISKTTILNNGGIPKLRKEWKIIRDKFAYSAEGILWRTSVFARDNWTCQKCKIRGTELHAHHILNFNAYEELRASITNGITFCKNCHLKFHSKFGKSKNTKEQILGWLENV